MYVVLHRASGSHKKFYFVSFFFFKNYSHSCFTLLCQFSQQTKSAICRHISPLFVDFLPIQITTEHRVESLYSRFSLVIEYVALCICQSQSPSSSHTPHSLLVLYIHVSISAVQIRSSIPFFLDYTYMRSYMIFALLFLTYFSLYDQL